MAWIIHITQLSLPLQTRLISLVLCLLSSLSRPRPQSSTWIPWIPRIHVCCLRESSCVNRLHCLAAGHIRPDEEGDFCAVLSFIYTLIESAAYSAVLCCRTVLCFLSYLFNSFTLLPLTFRKTFLADIQGQAHTALTLTPLRVFWDRSPSWQATLHESTTCSWCLKMFRGVFTSAPLCQPPRERRRRASLRCTSTDPWRLRVGRSHFTLTTDYFHF